MEKQILTIFLLVAIVSSGMLYPLTARAQFFDLSTILNWIYENVLDVLRQHLILMVQDTVVRYIQGDDNLDPRFFQNFSSIGEDAFQSATRDIAQEIGISNLCSEQLTVRLKLQLLQPQFRQRIDCTLDDIIGNAFGGFYKDFTTGGWLAYQETLYPQNNRWGIEITVFDELIRKDAENVETTRLEALVGDGFIGQRRCEQWTETGPFTVQAHGGQVAGIELPPSCFLNENKLVVCSGEEFYASTPDAQPVDWDNLDKGFVKNYTSETNQPPGSQFKCTEPRIVSPGQSVAAAATQMIKGPLSKLSNATGIQQILGAALDAALARAASETSRGLAYGSLKGENDPDCESLNTGGVGGEADIGTELAVATCEAGAVISDLVESAGKLAADALKGLFGSTGTEILGEVSESIESASTTISGIRNKNDSLLVTLADLKTCLQDKGETITTAQSALSSIDNDLAVVTSAFNSFVTENHGSPDIDFWDRGKKALKNLQSYGALFVTAAENVTSGLVPIDAAVTSLNTNKPDITALNLVNFEGQATERITLITTFDGLVVDALDQFNEISNMLYDHSKGRTHGSNYNLRSELQELIENSLLQPTLQLSDIIGREVNIITRVAERALNQCQ